MRGYRDVDGDIFELLPSEYHDDGVASAGIYTFYNFGWSFVDLLREVFSVVQIGVGYDVEHGMLFCDSAREWWNMAPLIFRCYR